MSVININSSNFDEIIKSGVVVVDFFANWCGPCKMLSPIIEEVSNEMNDVVFAKINVDESSDIAGKFSVMSIPTLIIFKDGVSVSKNVGFLSKSELKEFVMQNK